MRLVRVVFVDELFAAMNSNGAGACGAVGAVRLPVASDNATERKSEKRILSAEK